MAKSLEQSPEICSRIACANGDMSSPDRDSSSFHQHTVCHWNQSILLTLSKMALYWLDPLFRRNHVATTTSGSSSNDARLGVERVCTEDDRGSLFVNAQDVVYPERRHRSHGWALSHFTLSR